MDAGSVERLFPLLKDWSKEELKALLGDVEKHHGEALGEIEKARGAEALKPENFFSGWRSKRVDAAAGRAKLQVMLVCAEIVSVAEYYLARR